ncbi:MAG: helix-turn-helix transcriptional regulator [Myxococcales bacterium]|nr:helix-turn-helix transcriptional regulator [Myxococcales bacterium]
MGEEFPQLLRRHRTRRRWSQEQLGHEAEVSARHLSCLETGKSRPSREMVLVLASVLELELRERNAMLVSAGYAAAYATTALDARAMAPIQRAIDLVLTQQEPYGAILVDRCWNVLRTNQGARRLLGSFLDPTTLPDGVATNLVRATLHPNGLRPHIVNWSAVAAVLVERVERAHLANPEDEDRRQLFDLVRAEVGPHGLGPPPDGAPFAVVHLRRGDLELRLFTLLTTIGTPLDVTAQDLTVETLFPADAATERWFQAVALDRRLNV